MKPILKLSLLAATVVLAVGCQKEEKQADVAAPAKAMGASEVVLKTDDEKAAYAIGVSFANYLNASIEKPSQLGIHLDKKVVLDGIEDVFDGKAALTEAETKAALENLDQRVATQLRKQVEEKAAAAKKSGEEFSTKFAKEAGVVTTPSGLMYQVITEGKGPKPTATDTVVVNYKGTLTDGTVFDSSYDRGEPATFPLNRVISGWTEGVQLMPVGSKFKFVIPPKLAYGDQPTASIPANSTLVFEVELLKIEGQPAAKKSTATSTPAKN